MARSQDLWVKAESHTEYHALLAKYLTGKLTPSHPGNNPFDSYRGTNRSIDVQNLTRSIALFCRMKPVAFGS